MSIQVSGHKIASGQAHVSGAGTVTVVGGASAPSGVEGTAILVPPPTANEIHAHEWPIATPLDAFTGTLVAAGVTYVVLRGRFTFHRSLDDDHAAP